MIKHQSLGQKVKKCKWARDQKNTQNMENPPFPCQKFSEEKNLTHQGQNISEVERGTEGK